MKTPMKRWTCPTCNKGVLAPSRPRKDDVRRYCLPCSAKTGRLVERSCLSLERERSVKSERATARRVAKEKKDRARARVDREAQQQRARRIKESLERQAIAQRMAGDIDMQAEAFRLWNLPYVRQQPQWYRRLPEIEFRHSNTKKYTSGHCWGHGSQARIVLTIGTDPYDALAALLHEFIHAVMPNGEHHGDRFWRTLRSAAREAWPNAVFQFNLPATTKWERQRQIVNGLHTLEERAAVPT